MCAQQRIAIDATLDPGAKELSMQQRIHFVNQSNDELSEIYLFDWANSFSSKTTPLAERFSDNFDWTFHFEKKEERGRTTIDTVRNENGQQLSWKRGEEVDIVVVNLSKPLLPGESIDLDISLSVRLPDARFTRFGYTDDGRFLLRYWHLVPAVYNGKWQVYSNTNTEDLYMLPTDYEITLKAHPRYSVATDLEIASTLEEDAYIRHSLYGKNRMNLRLFIEPRQNFEHVVTDQFEVVTDLLDNKVNPPSRALFIDRISRFLEEKIGPYPFEKMLVSEADYKRNPVYGLNQLPDFISPFPNGFEFDMEQLKTITGSFLENTLVLHPRQDYWLYGAIQIYLMMEYVDRYYPNMKIIGDLSNFWVIRWSHASDLEFNDQYPLLYLNMARNNLNQTAFTSRDELTKFNKNIAVDYHAGQGLKYLSDYLGEEVLESTLLDFVQKSRSKPSTSRQFLEMLKERSELPVDWFFSDYLGTRIPIDFKITKVIQDGDSLQVVVKNKRETQLPVSLYGLDRDSVVYKTWLRPIRDRDTVTIPANGIKKLVLNYEAHIPEYNQRNNYKNLDGLLNRPIQFRFFQDVEDPAYNQVFFMPVFSYNIYDGFIVGPKMYNKTVLPKGIHYKLEPQIGLRSNTLVGSGSISYTQFLYGNKLYRARYGISANYFSYDRNLFYRRFTPYVQFTLRNDKLRDNTKQFITFRNVNVSRDPDPNDPEQEPNYSVFNFRYTYSNPNLIHFFKADFDYQLSSRFSKLSATLEYRKLFLSNRQLNLRFYAGAFIFNSTDNDDDFFSFALDRPTDYLFDYNYYGRSEEQGLFSQQLIVAEGGFKSQLQPAFANSWITTVNASTNIWKWIFAYADAGLVHNRGRGTSAVFDTGVRVSLVADYFELFFPLYSNLGWEPGLGNYDQRIRFIVTLSLRTLFGLFTREWY